MESKPPSASDSKQLAHSSSGMYNPFDSNGSIGSLGQIEFGEQSSGNCNT